MKEKIKKSVDWIGRHWVVLVIGAAASYVMMILFKAVRDKGIGPNGEPYYADFASAEEKEGTKDETE